jgi:hypothetical protein
MPALRLTRAKDVPAAAGLPGAASHGAGPSRVEAAGAAAIVDPSPLVGAWESFDPATRGLVRVEIGSRGGRLLVRAFGAADPERDLQRVPAWPREAAPADWGEVAGAAFADGVDGTAAVGFTAVYRFGFMDAMLAAYLNRRLLVVDTYAVFHDGSGRPAYFARDHFYQPAESAREAASARPADPAHPAR